MDNAGAVVGPLLAALLLSLHVPLREIFLWAVLPTIVTVGLALCLKEPVMDSIVVPAKFTWSMDGLSLQFK